MVSSGDPVFQVITGLAVDVFDDPNDKLEAFNFLFTDVLDCHAPLKTIQVWKNSSLWITKSIRKEMDRRDRLFRFYCRNPSTGAWDIFKAVLFGFKGKLKWSIFINYYARSHILLASGTHSSLLLLLQLRLHENWLFSLLMIRPLYSQWRHLSSSIFTPNLSQSGKSVAPKEWFEIEHLKNKEYAHPLE